MHYIKNADILSFKVNFTFNDKGETRLKTLIGGTLSIFLIIISSIFTIYFLYRKFNRLDANVIYSTERIETLNLTYSSKIPFMFRVSDTYSKPIPNENIYHTYIRLWYTIENSTIQLYEEIPMSKCDINKHFGNFKKYFINMSDLNSFICPDIRLDNQIIYGIYGGNLPFSYYDFNVLKCLNNTIFNLTCKSEEEIHKKLSDAYLDLRFIDFTLDSLNKDKVEKIVIKSERFSISSTMYKRIWLYLTDIKFITDKGIIFSSSYEENFYKYDSMRFDTDLRNIDILDEPGDFLSFTILSSGNAVIYHRNYFKIQDYLATIGGIIKSVTLLCHIINHFNAKNAYFTKIITDFIIHNQLKVFKINDEDINQEFNKQKYYNLNTEKSNNNTSNLNSKSDHKLNSYKNSNNLSFIRNLNENKKNIKFKTNVIRQLNTYSVVKQKDKFKKHFTSHFIPLHLSSKFKNKVGINSYIKIIHKKMNIINILNSIEKNTKTQDILSNTILRNTTYRFPTSSTSKQKINNYIIHENINNNEEIKNIG